MMRVFLCFVVVGFLTLACKQDMSLAEMEKKESSRDCRNDSLFQGIHFGMTKKEFYEHCFEMNQKRLFFQSEEGVQVKYVMNEGFDSPVVLNFFPRFQQDDTIRVVSGNFAFQQWTPFQKQFRGSELIGKLIDKWQKWYGGNEFVKVPSKDDQLSLEYVKVDCNRRITLKHSLINDEKIYVLFEEISR